MPLKGMIYLSKTTFCSGAAVTEAIEPDDLTIKDLFSQAQMDREHYDVEMATIYCQYIMEGNSMAGAAEKLYLSLNPDCDYDDYNGLSVEEIAYKKGLLRREGLRLLSQFARWRVKFDRFDKMVQLAIRERSYAYVEEMIEIADDATDDAIMGSTGPIVNGKAIRRAELMINTRKFLAAKMLPKVFGDKTQMELTGADGKDLVPTTFNIGLIAPGTFLDTPEPGSEKLEAGEDEQHV